VEHLGTPFAWSIVVVLAIAVAAAMIVYGIHTLRKKDEPDPLYGGVSGTLKEDWTRTGNIDFHVVALDSASPQHAILRVDSGGSQRGCGLLECSSRVIDTQVLLAIAFSFSVAPTSAFLALSPLCWW